MKFLSKIIIVGALLAVSSSTNSKDRKNEPVKQELEPLSFPVIEKPFKEVTVKLNEVSTAIHTSQRELMEIRLMLEQKRYNDSLIISKYADR